MKKEKEMPSRVSIAAEHKPLKDIHMGNWKPELVNTFTNDAVTSRGRHVSETKPNLFDEYCAHKTRSMESYDVKTRCIFCGQGDRSKGRQKDHELILSRTLCFDDTLLDKCTGRQDEWASRVQGILSYVSDLHSADAVYHHRCRTNFLTGKKDIPGIFQDTGIKKCSRLLKDPSPFRSVWNPPSLMSTPRRLPVDGSLSSIWFAIQRSGSSNVTTLVHWIWLPIVEHSRVLNKCRSYWLDQGR